MHGSGAIQLPSGFVRDLAAARSRREVLSVAATWMPQIISAERASIALPSPGSAKHLEIFAMGGSLVISQGTALAIETSLIGRAYQSLSVVNVPRLREITADEVDRLVSAGLKSALIAPLLSGGRALGTINLANSRPGFFTAEHETLLGSVADLIASFLSVHQQAETEKERARTDSLTGCLNRRAIIDRLEASFIGLGERPSLLYIDVDSFKSINDSHGHHIGDHVLRSLAKRISGSCDAADQIGRLGGDEFLVVVVDDPDGHRARRLAATIATVCSMPLSAQAIEIAPRISIGVASLEHKRSTAQDLLKDADQAMYEAKTSGRPIAVADDGIRARTAMVATIDRDLDLGMMSGQITYHLQPVRNVETREILGAEALIRWNHPHLGTIPAPLLIERLESTGRTEAFSRWSLEAIAREWHRVREELPWFDDKAVSFNLTPRQLAWSGYCDYHLQVLDRFGFRPQDIIIEVVESSEIQPGDPAEKTLRQLGDENVIIALDDFGTGHNALGYFTMFPIHAMKFDRSLVCAMAEHDAARTVLTGLTRLAHDLDIVAVAEGIESAVEAELCIEAGIEHGQGWHFGRPAPVTDFIAMAFAEGPPARRRHEFESQLEGLRPREAQLSDAQLQDV